MIYTTDNERHESLVADYLIDAVMARFGDAFVVDVDARKNFIVDGRCRFYIQNHLSQFRHAMRQTTVACYEYTIDMLKEITSRLEHATLSEISYELQRAMRRDELSSSHAILEDSPELAAKYVVGDVIRIAEDDGYLMQRKRPYSGFDILWCDGTVSHGISRSRLECLNIPVVIYNHDRDHRVWTTRYVI
jgi:hypothetical protein